MIKTKLLIAAAFAAASTLASAQVITFGVGVPGPVYVAPPPPVYVTPPRYYAPPPPPVYYGPRHHWERRDYYGGYRHGHHGGWRDNDRDGVPNRYDYAPNNPYRR